jgi:hypothetical protein
MHPTALEQIVAQHVAQLRSDAAEHRLASQGRAAGRWSPAGAIRRTLARLRRTPAPSPAATEPCMSPAQPMVLPARPQRLAEPDGSAVPGPRAGPTMAATAQCSPQ